MSWTAGAFVNQLTTLLSGRAVLVAMTNPKLEIGSMLPARDLAIGDQLAIGYRVDDEHLQALLPVGHDNNVNVECWLAVVRVGEGEPVAAEARTDATTILNDIDAAIIGDLTPGGARSLDVGTLTIKAGVSRRVMLQYATTVDNSIPARVCQLDFTVTYMARTST